MQRDWDEIDNAGSIDGKVSLLGAMRIWIFSDLYIEQSRWDMPDPAPDYGVLIAAGDIHDPLSAGVRWQQKMPSIRLQSAKQNLTIAIGIKEIPSAMAQKDAIAVTFNRRIGIVRRRGIAFNGFQ